MVCVSSALRAILFFSVSRADNSIFASAWCLALVLKATAASSSRLSALFVASTNACSLSLLLCIDLNCDNNNVSFILLSKSTNVDTSAFATLPCVSRDAACLAIVLAAKNSFSTSGATLLFVGGIFNITLIFDTSSTDDFRASSNVAVVATTTPVPFANALFSRADSVPMAPVATASNVFSLS